MELDDRVRRKTRVANTEDLARVDGLNHIAKLLIDYADDYDADYLRASGASVNLAPLAGAYRLEVLHVLAESVVGIESLSELPALRSLTIWLDDDEGLPDLQPLAGLRRLSKLRFAADAHAGLEPLAHLSELRTLEIRSRFGIDVQPLAGLENLAHLTLHGGFIEDLPHLRNLSSLHGLTGLTNLELDWWQGVDLDRDLAGFRDGVTIDAGAHLRSFGHLYQ